MISPADKYSLGILLILFKLFQYFLSSLSFIFDVSIDLDFIIVNNGSLSGILLNFLKKSVCPSLRNS